MENYEYSVREHYVNSVSLNYSTYEIRMELFVETPNDDSNSVSRKEVADIRLSPQLAKELVHLLSSTVDSYEKTVGEIPCPGKAEN